MQPGEAEEVKPSHRRYAAGVDRAAAGVENRCVHPAILGTEPRSPDDRGGSDDLVTLAVEPVARGAHDPREKPDAQLAGQRLRAGPDENLSAARPPAEPRVDAHPDQSGRLQPPEEASSEESLRQPGQPFADGEA